MGTFIDLMVDRIKIGIIGKTNAGKTTFFNSATMQTAEMSTYPFTTKAPNTGVAKAMTLCVHKEFSVTDQPRNSTCIEGWRQIPVDLIDLPGLIKGAHLGKGLGNQFLSVAAQSDALLHVVDASGSIDAEGRLAGEGVGDPIADVGDIEEEMAMWFLKLIQGNMERVAREMKAGVGFSAALANVLAGIKVSRNHIEAALRDKRLEGENFTSWSDSDIKGFAWALRDISKPTLIVANKMDLPSAAKNFTSLQDQYSDMFVVPASAEAELTLRRAEQKGLIRYVPGEERFEVTENASLNEKQRAALNNIRSLLGQYMRTGVQFAINIAVFKLLRMNAVYPVSDTSKLSDTSGAVLPDVFLMPTGSRVQDLANEIHSDLAKGLLYAIDVRTGIRLPADYELKDRDVLSIISATRRKRAT